MTTDYKYVKESRRPTLPRKRAAHWYSCFQVVILLATVGHIYVMFYYGTFYDENMVDLTPIEYVRDSWEAPFLVDVIVLDGNETCPGDNKTLSKPLFNYTWPGTVDRCDCTGLEPKLGACESTETCIDVDGKAPMTTHLVKDKLICGKSLLQGECTSDRHKYQGIRFPDKDGVCESVDEIPYVLCPGPRLLEN